MKAVRLLGDSGIFIIDVPTVHTVHGATDATAAAATAATAAGVTATDSGAISGLKLSAVVAFASASL